MSGHSSLRGTLLAAFVVCVSLAGVSPVLAQSAQPKDAFDGLGLVDDGALKDLHGRDANISYDIKGENNLNASINGSSISAGGDITTGALGFSGNAMQGFQGLSNFVANTGNNNNLQASMVVNITLN